MPSNFLDTNIQKKKQRRDLRSFFVEVEDDSPKAAEFLNISQLGDEFSLGKNAFIIRGSEKLVSGAPVLVEILDSEGGVIYTETHDYEESGGRIISVYVYEGTPTGPAEITIMTEVSEDREGNSIPEDSRGIYNYRWTQTINVNPNVYNINNVRFRRSPEVRSENVTLKEYNILYGGDQQRETEIDSKDFSPNLGVTGLLNLEEHENKVSVLDIDSSCGSSFSLLRGMEGGTITFRNPASNFNLGSSICNEYNITDDQTFTFDIEQVLNKERLRIKSRESVRESLPRRVSLDCNDDFVINFLRKDPTSVQSTGDPSCFIQLELDNLSTISGAVLRSSIYVRKFDSDNPFTFVGDFELDPKELLVDFENPNTRREKRTGLFLEQQDIDDYLVPLNSYTVLEWDEDNLLNSVNVKREHSSLGVIENRGYNSSDEDYGGAQILGPINQVAKGSQGSSNTFDFGDDSDAVLGFKIPMFGSSGDVRLEENVTYNLKFRYLLDNRGEEFDNSRFGVFLRFRRKGKDGSKEYEVEERLEDYKVFNDQYGFGRVDLEFESLTSSLSGDYCDLQLVIKIEDGNWYFSNFSLTPSQKPGFSPDFTTVTFNLDSSILNQVGNPLEFRTDLFDLNKNRIPVDLRTESGLDVSECGNSSDLDFGGSGTDPIFDCSS